MFPVAREGLAPIKRARVWRVRHVTLPFDAGLSFGRNALVAKVTTPYLVMMDDDVQFHAATNLRVLLKQLEADPQLGIAGGCFVDAFASGSLRAAHNCYTLMFEPEEGGAIVRSRIMPYPRSGCMRAHSAHNFFMGRTADLTRLQWDP